MKKQHLGSIIKQKVSESRMTTKEFAAKINLERTSVYHIYKQNSIDIERLKLISEVLNYDFISEVYQEKKNETTPSKQTVFLAIEVDSESLQKLNLPDEIIRFIRKQN
jgi:transcriptional regulator with XRE-family HTH domain